MGKSYRKKPVQENPPDEGFDPWGTPKDHSKEELLQQNPGSRLNAQQFAQIPVNRQSAEFTPDRTHYHHVASTEHGVTGATASIEHAKDQYSFVEPLMNPAKPGEQGALFTGRHTPAKMSGLYATVNRPEGAPRNEIVTNLIATAIGDHMTRTGQRVVPDDSLSPGSIKYAKQANPDAKVTNDVSIGYGENRAYAVSELLHESQGADPPSWVREKDLSPVETADAKVRAQSTFLGGKPKHKTVRSRSLQPPLF
jgi:hypothetical protein